MNYLIFGGEGFIGAHLASYLAESVAGPSDKIYSLDIRRQPERESPAGFIACDVRNPIRLDHIPDPENSIIFNLAAVHTTPGHPDHEYFETNIKGAENICDFARAHGIRKIVFTSSIAPYGPSEEEKSESSSIPMPNSPYGISKLVAEYIHQNWLTEDRTARHLFIVRPGVVFGKGEGGNFTRLYNALKKGFFFYPGRKDTIKASVYVKDVARILWEGIDQSLPGKPETYNLTYAPAPTIEVICETIASVTKVSKPAILVPAIPLKTVASMLYFSGKLIGKTFNGIHPDRVRKLMISTNINGEKLEQSSLKLRYTLKDAIEDWYVDCGNEGLR